MRPTDPSTPDTAQGFLTTFTLLGRDHFTLGQMSWMLIQVFFGPVAEIISLPIRSCAADDAVQGRLISASRSPRYSAFS